MFGIDCFRGYQLSHLSGVMMEKEEGAGASGGGGSGAGHSVAIWWQG